MMHDASSRMINEMLRLDLQRLTYLQITCRLCRCFSPLFEVKEHVVLLLRRFFRCYSLIKFGKVYLVCVLVAFFSFCLLFVLVLIAILFCPFGILNEYVCTVVYTCINRFYFPSYVILIITSNAQFSLILARIFIAEFSNRDCNT